MLRMQVSVFMEMLISALLAPIRMLSHTRFVLEALFNLKLKWAGQNRSGESGWGEALPQSGVRHRAGVELDHVRLLDDPMFFIWSLPVAIPLIFAAPIFVLLSRIQAGQHLSAGALLRIPEETDGSPLLKRSWRTILSAQSASSVVRLYREHYRSAPQRLARRPGPPPCAARFALANLQALARALPG